MKPARHFRLCARIAALTGAALSLAVPTMAAAQTPSVAQTQKIMDAKRKLTTALPRIAADGQNGFALLDAGEAALVLGDTQTAFGFLVRAEQILPREGRVKSALGATMIALGKPDQALRYFGEAEAMGAVERAYLAERGLAYDLAGNFAAAQRDYRSALGLDPGNAQVTRSYALSLGISGNVDAGLNMLAPLLATQDRAAWRARAFILAMNGQERAANATVDAVMPSEMANSIKPYLAQMDRLTPAQKAAAVHFGRFPSGDLGSAPVRVASAEPARQQAAAKRTPKRQASRRERPQSVSVGKRIAVTTTPIETPPPIPTPAPTPPPTPSPVQTPSPAVASAATRMPTIIIPEPSRSDPEDQAPVARTVMATPIRPSAVAAADSLPTTSPGGDTGARPGFSIIERGEPAGAGAATRPTSYGPPADPAGKPVPSLFDIVAAIDVAGANPASDFPALSAADLERVKQEKLAAQDAEEKREQAQRAKAEAAEKAKREAAEDAKAKAANPARHWVQIATGADLKALGFDYRRYAKSYPELFKGQSGWTSAWGKTRRLVVGPFDSQKDAKAWEADYRKAGGDAFTWSSSDGLEVEKLGGK